MKYLYKILRLFFCPHKYNKLLGKGDIVVNKYKVVDDKLYANGYDVTGNYYNKECCYCGKVKVFNMTT